MVLGWLGVAEPVLAHAIIVKSEPPDLCQAAFVSESICANGQVLGAAPGEVRIWFSEPVQPFGGGIVVLGPSGRAVQGTAQAGGNELFATVDAREKGTYVVRWRIIAADTHPSRGEFAFSVGHTSAPAGTIVSASLGAISPLGLILQSGARWLHFLGYALGFGVLAFRLFVLEPLNLSAEASVERRVWRLINLGILALLVAEPLALLGQTASLSAGEMLDPAVVSGALDSSFGRVLALRLGAAMFLWVLVGFVKDASRSAAAHTTPVTGSPVPLALALVAGWVLALIDGAAAHAESIQPAAWGLTLNALHVASMGVWLGGLAAVLALWRLPALGARRQTMAARFTPLALTALGLLLATGLLMGWLHLALPADVLADPYAIVLAVKSTAVLLALLPAALALKRLRARPTRWWLVELAALLTVAALAGLLVSLPPPA